MDHALEHTGAGHVDAVVIARAQVERGEVAVGKSVGQSRVTPEQRRRAVAMALGLKDLIALDGAELADRAVNRADPVGLGQGPCVGPERAREKLVEAGVAPDVRLGSLGHIDTIATHKPGNQRGGAIAAAAIGHATGKTGQGLLGQQVLDQDAQTFRHGTPEGSADAGRQSARFYRSATQGAAAQACRRERDPENS
jgi:hypothetical protein